MWTIEYPERPWTLNSERTWHYHKRAKKVKEWREAFCLLAQTQEVPGLERVVIVATPVLRSHMQDVANCLPAVKAAIDGIVDAGVLVDDEPEYLRAIIFNAPERGPNALRIDIHEAK